MTAFCGEVPVNFKNDMRDGWTGMSKKRQKQVFSKEFSQKMVEANMGIETHHNISSTHML